MVCTLGRAGVAAGADGGGHARVADRLGRHRNGHWLRQIVTRRKTMPVLTGAGLKVSSTFCPPCTPRPTARVMVLSVRCCSTGRILRTLLQRALSAGLARALCRAARRPSPFRAVRVRAAPARGLRVRQWPASDALPTRPRRRQWRSCAPDRGRTPTCPSPREVAQYRAARRRQRHFAGGELRRLGRLANRRCNRRAVPRALTDRRHESAAVRPSVSAAAARRAGPTRFPTATSSRRRGGLPWRAAPSTT